MSIIKNIVSSIASNIAKPITGEVSQSGEPGSYILNVERGSFTSTGYDPDLRRFKLEVDRGSFTSTGYDPDLRRERILNVDRGSFTSTGYDVTFTYNAGNPSVADSDAQAIVDESIDAGWDMTQDQADQIQTLVSTLKTDGVWSKMDTLYMMHSDNIDAAAIDWKNPTGTPATQVSSPAFTAFEGIGLNGGCLEPATDFGDYANYGQNDNHVGVGLYANSGVTRPVYEQNGTNSDHFFYHRYSGTNECQLKHDTNSFNIVSNSSDGHANFCVVRTSSTNINVYRNGSSLGSVTTGVAQPPESDNIELPSRNTASNYYIKYWHAGQSLTATEASNLDTAMDTYLANQTA